MNTDEERTEIEEEIMNWDLDEMAQDLADQVYDHILDCENCMRSVGAGHDWFNAIELDPETVEIVCWKVDSLMGYRPEGILLHKVGTTQMTHLIQDLGAWARDTDDQIRDDLRTYVDNGMSYDGLSEDEIDSVEGIYEVLANNKEIWADKIKAQLKSIQEEERYV